MIRSKPNCPRQIFARAPFFSPFFPTRLIKYTNYRCNRGAVCITENRCSPVWTNEGGRGGGGGESLNNANAEIVIPLPPSLPRVRRERLKRGGGIENFLREKGKKEKCFGRVERFVQGRFSSFVSQLKQALEISNWLFP